MHAPPVPRIGPGICGVSVGGEIARRDKLFARFLMAKRYVQPVIAEWVRRAGFGGFRPLERDADRVIQHLLSGNDGSARFLGGTG